MGIARFLHRYLVRQTFPGLVVPYYDRMIDALADIYLGPLCRQVLHAFPGPARIVDAGSGTGQLATMLAQANSAYTVLAVDLSEACLRAGRRRAHKLGLADRVTFIAANLERCPIESGSSDLVLSTCSLHHWRRPVRVLRELARLLRPGGEIWLLDDSADATHQARAAWVTAVEQTARPGPLFRVVFWFESRFLAYSREEVATLCAEAGLELLDFAVAGPFLQARMQRQRPTRSRL